MRADIHAEPPVTTSPAPAVGLSPGVPVALGSGAAAPSAFAAAHGYQRSTVDSPSETVTFSAGRGGTVQPGGSVTFDFGVYGVLQERPYDCLVNGERCS